MRSPSLPWARLALLAAALLLSACSSVPTTVSQVTTRAPDPAAVRSTLAPTGVLRVAVYPGSPTSLVRSAGNNEMRGLTVDIGRELAARLGVPAEIVVFERVAQVVEAVKTGRADFTITNATPERAADLDFSEAVVSLELGVLVGANSPLLSVDGMDKAGLRIGVSQGSSSQRVLGGRLKSSTLVAAPSLAAASAQIKAGQIDGFATNKAILFEMADGVPGSRVLPGSWGQEHLAMGITKAADPNGAQTAAVRAFLQRFNADVRSGGQVQAAATRAGLRGLAPTR